MTRSGRRHRPVKRPARTIRWLLPNPKIVIEDDGLIRHPLKAKPAEGALHLLKIWSLRQPARFTPPCRNAVLTLVRRLARPDL